MTKKTYTVDQANVYTTKCSNKLIKNLVGTAMTQCGVDEKYIQLLIGSSHRESVPAAVYYIAQLVAGAPDGLLLRLPVADSLEEMARLVREEAQGEVMDLDQLRETARTIRQATEAMNQTARQAERNLMGCRENLAIQEQLVKLYQERTADLKGRLATALDQIQQRDGKLQKEEGEKESLHSRLTALEDEMRREKEDYTEMTQQLKELRSRCQTLEQEGSQAAQLLEEERERSSRYLRYIKFMREQIPDPSVPNPDTDRDHGGRDTVHENTKKMTLLDKLRIWLHGGSEPEGTPEPSITEQEFLTRLIQDGEYDFARLEFMIARYTEDHASLEDLRLLAAAPYDKYKEEWKTLQTRRQLMEKVKEAAVREGHPHEDGPDKVWSEIEDLINNSGQTPGGPDKDPNHP